ncbi:hypothetical protein J3E69DRAFT_342877 [Trichoderma sp. SZMC 28015]
MPRLEDGNAEIEAVHENERRSLARGGRIAERASRGCYNSRAVACCTRRKRAGSLVKPRTKQGGPSCSWKLLVARCDEDAESHRRPFAIPKERAFTFSTQSGWTSGSPAHVRRRSSPLPFHPVLSYPVLSRSVHGHGESRQGYPTSLSLGALHHPQPANLESPHTGWMLKPCQTRAHLATKRRETTRDPLRGVKPLQGSLLTFTSPSPATGCRRPPIGGVLRPGRLIRLCGWLLTGLVSKLSIWRRLNKENCLSLFPRCEAIIN